ncbi:MAG TPA: peptidyl-prolyl cis-trans isomerase [Thermoanaerobaculia bacterium]|nr:peptidyl-prolyl cis-trans isomerase [Thermoanaerobaculia bacterium]
MLKTFRENFKHLQWILWIVIAIFVVFVFVDWGMGSAGRSGGAGDTEVAARAGDIKISVADFTREYRSTEDRYRSLYGKNWSPDLLKAMNLPEQVLNTMIDRRLMREEVSRLRLTVSDDELSARILGVKDNKGSLVFVKDGTFVGEATYRRMLASIGMTPEAYEAQTRDEILLQKLNRFFTESTFVSDEEVEKDFTTRNVKAKIAYVLKPAGSAAPAVSDAEAEEHFRKNTASYQLPERRKAKYLLVETGKVKPQIAVSDGDVANEYNANADQYRHPEEAHARHILYKSDGTPSGDAAAKAKADAAVAKVKKGGDFAALAKAESDDPGSKANGGDVGSFGRGRMVKEFEDAAFAAEPNAIVGPVKTSYGYHVIQVLGKTPERVQPLFEVSAQIKSQLQEKKAADEAKRIARDLADRLAKIPKPSDDQLRKLTSPVISLNETDWLARGDAPQGLGFVPAFTKALFTMQPGDVSEPVTTPRGEALVKLTDVKPPGPPTFAEAKQRVIADLAKKKQDEESVQALTAAMAQEPTLEGIASKTGLKVETPESFGKNAPIPGLGAASALSDAAFAANVGDVRGPIVVPEKGAVVFRLVEKTPFDKAAYEAQKFQIKDSLRSQKANRLMQALVARRRAEMKVVVNRELLSRFTG